MDSRKNAKKNSIYYYFRKYLDCHLVSDQNHRQLFAYFLKTKLTVLQISKWPLHILLSLESTTFKFLLLS
jgi:hypothetical protein